MANKKDWLSRTADDAPAPMPSTRPLSEVDKIRPAPTAQPTAAPQPAEPMPMNDLLKQFENAAKDLHDAGLSLEKACVAIKDITSSTGRTPSEQAVISKAEGFISQVESAKEMVSNIGDSVSEYRGSLGENRAAAASSWIK